MDKALQLHILTRVLVRLHRTPYQVQAQIRQADGRNCRASATDKLPKLPFVLTASWREEENCRLLPPAAPGYVQVALGVGLGFTSR